MEKEELESLLWRYQNDLCTDEERQKVEQWYETLEPGNPASFGSHEMENIRHSIRSRLTVASPPRKKAVRTSVVYRAAACATVVALVVTFYFFYAPGNDKNRSITETQVLFRFSINNSKKDTTIQLADGSSVKLFPGASLRYPAIFPGQKREVFLYGDGFFAVSKDSVRPFFVYSDQLVVKVLGTSFVVRSQKEKSMVAVHTGRVAVFKNQSGQSHENGGGGKLSIVLTPNQQVVYQASYDSFRTSLVNEPHQLTTQSPISSSTLKFENEAMDNVLTALGEAYGIVIKATNPSLLKCRFTGDISESSFSLSDKLQMLCQAIDASYKVSGVDILLEGKGCN